MTELPEPTVVSINEDDKSHNERISRSTPRHYPKERDGATHHWKAVMSHVEEYDKAINAQTRKLKLSNR